MIHCFGVEGGLGWGNFSSVSLDTNTVPQNGCSSNLVALPTSPIPSDSHLCFSLFSHSKQNFDPPFRRQGNLGCKKNTNRLGYEFCVRPGFYRPFGDGFGELPRIQRFQQNEMLGRQDLEFLDSEQIFDPIPELKEVLDKKFTFTNRLRYECGIPGWM